MYNINIRYLISPVVRALEYNNSTVALLKKICNTWKMVNKHWKKGVCMKITKNKNKNKINKNELKITNIFYKGGYKYTIKVKENTDILIVYKQDLYTNFEEYTEFKIDTIII